MKIEPLEARIAPATLINPTTVIFHDLDGDDVTVKFSQPILTDLATANAILKFNNGVVVEPATTNGAFQQLQLIDFTAAAAAQAGIGVTVTAKRSAGGGDGFSDVGYVNGTGLDLGAVSIAGDLGAIDAGNPNASGSALKALTVQSLGELGTSTGAPDLVSQLDGRVDKLTVKGHIRDARVTVLDSVISDPGGNTDGEASIGALVIGGSLIGGAAQLSGQVTVGDRIDSAKIAGDIRGGSAAQSGRLDAVRGFGAVTLGGSLIGGGLGTGWIATALGGIDSLSIGGDIRGGSADSSGQVRVGGDDAMKSFKLGGSLVGGAGATSGTIDLAGPVAAFAIAGDVRGGGANFSGQVSILGLAKTITIGGSLRGAASEETGTLDLRAVGTLKIGGSLLGGGMEAGSIFATTITTATIGGSLVGGVGEESGALIASGSLGTLKIAGSLIGGAGNDSGRIDLEGGLGSLTVGGSLVGGSGEDSAKISVGGELKKGSIAGDLRGGVGPESGSFLASDRATALTVGGSAYSGGGLRSGSLLFGDDVLSLTIKGSLVGLPTQPVAIVGENATAPAAGTHLVLGKITIGGRVENALILAGYDFLDATNGDAQIGSVTVGGDWIASSIAAGVDDGADNRFGTADDQAIVAGNTAGIASRIGSVTIKGQALGSVASGDAFGIVAEQLGSIKVGLVAETLVAGEVDAVPLGATLDGTTPDFVAREDVVGAAVTLPVLIDSGPGAGFVSLNAPDSATEAYWTDADGDLVTLKTTKPLLDFGDFTFVASGAGIQVQRIDWTGDATAANQGVGLTITARPQDLNEDGILDGDGSVNIGYLSAIGLDLGAVKITGDLARLEAGDAILTDAALTSLTVQSIGTFGKSTQAAGANLAWQLRGSVGSIAVRGDLNSADIVISGTSGGAQLDNGGLGKLTIGGSLRGGATVADGGAGQIDASGKIGAVTIGGDIVGGVSDRGGRIASRDTIGAVKIGGSLVGGLGEVTGQIFTPNGIASVKIGRDLRGGSDDQAGSIDGGTSLGAVTIGGSMIGGAGEESGSVLAAGFAGSIKSVKVGGDVRGGIGEESAYIHAGQKLGAVTIAGSLVGGVGPAATDGALSATIYAGNAFADGPNTMASVTIGGDVLAGSGSGSASIGAVFGQLGNPAQLNIGKIAIKGSVVGSSDTDASQSATINAGTIKSLTIGGSVRGGAAASSGLISTTGLVSTAKVGGSVIGGSAENAGSFTVDALGSLTIGGDLRGGSGNFSGQLFVKFSGAKSITIGGSLESGAGTRAGSVKVDGPLGSLLLKGSAWGTAADPALILARGTAMQTSPLALGKLTIAGSAEFLNVLGGFRFETQPENADANLGAITVGGTWRAGSITAGVDDGPNGFFGDADDVLGIGSDEAKHSKIASIVIKGRALGTLAAGDHFGFVAQEIGALKIGAVTFPLQKGPFNDDLDANDPRLLVSRTGDMRVHEEPQED